MIDHHSSSQPFSSLTLYSAFIEEIAELKRAVARRQVLCKPLENKGVH